MRVKDYQCTRTSYALTQQNLCRTLLGQHTDEVLHEYLGMTDAEISALRQEGVIGEKK